MQASEDAQPNEHRLANKGRNAVPIILTTRPVDRRTVGGPIRTGSQTASISSAPRWQSKPTDPAGFSYSQPLHAPGVGQSLPRRPDNSSLTSAPAPRERITGPERPWKKRRVDGPAQNAQGDHAHSSDRGGPVKPGKQDVGSKLTITVPLPPDCQSGAPRCTHRRRGWLKSKRRELEQTRGITVLNHSFKGPDVLFDCRTVRLEGPQPVCASSSSQAAHVPPSIAKRPIPPPVKKDVKSEQAAPSSSRLGAPRRRIDGHPGTERTCSSSTFNPDSLTPIPVLDVPSDAACEHTALSLTSPAQASQLQEESPSVALPVNSLHSVQGAGPSGLTCALFSPHYGKLADPSGPPGLDELQTANSGSFSSSAKTSRSSTLPMYSPSFRSGVLRIAPSVDAPPSDPGRREIQDPATAAERMDKAPASQLMPIHHASTESFPQITTTRLYPAPHHIFPTAVFSPGGSPPPEGAVDAAASSSRGGSPFAERLVPPTLSDASRVVSPHETEPVAELVRLARDSYDKPRRVLVSPSLGVLSITMHGMVTLVDRELPRRVRAIRAAVEGSREAVDDSCLLCGDNERYMVAAHVREDHQLSVMRIARDRLTDVCTVDRPAQPDKNRSASAVCAMMHSMMFASGGYDHMVHLWDASQDVSRPTPTPLAIRHTSTVQTLLALRDTSHKLVSGGADCNVHIYDLSSERVVNTLKLSNSVYHAHEAVSPFCTLLEVAHRELQFEIRDHRLVPRKPVQRFGYRTQKVHGRYVKGDVHSDTFACGDRDGIVRIWDLRDTDRVAEMIPCFSGQRITQVVFDDARLIACSEDHELAYIQPRSGG